MLSQQLLNLKRQVEWQKRKLYEKTMTKLAFYLLWDRFLDLFELELEFGYRLNILSHLLLFSFALDFGILDFYFTFPWKAPEIPVLHVPIDQWNLLNYVAYRKGIYDVTQYDMCYYDPVDWMEAIKRLAFYAVTHSTRYTTARDEVHSLAKSLDMPEQVVWNYLWRIDLILNAIDQAIFNGAWIVGRSRLGKCRKVRGKYVAEITFTTLDLEEKTTELSNLLEAACAPFCGAWVLGLNRVIKHTGEPVPSDFSWWVIRDVRGEVDRFIFNIGGRRMREYVPFHSSGKAMKYGHKMSIVTDIHMLVKSMLSNTVTDPIKLNAYCRFAVEYVLGRVKEHRPCKTGFLYVSDEDWERYVVTKWERKGLDRGIMKRIISLIKHYVEQLHREEFKRLMR